MEKKMNIETMKNKISNFFKESSEPPTISTGDTHERKILMENVNKQKETMKNKISNFFKESSVPPTISATVSAAIPLAVVAIPVVAGILYIKDRKKILNANTGDAFMNMGVGNF